MDSIDEQIARTETTVKAYNDNINKLTAEKTVVENELSKLKKAKSESEKRKERNEKFKFAIELLEFAMQRNDTNVSKVGWLAIEKIRDAISDVSNT